MENFDMKKSTDERWQFLLLQVNDALFPVGAYSHSFGLEAYIEKSIVVNVDTARDYLEKNLAHSLLYSEVLPASLAWDRANSRNLGAVTKLDEILTVSRTPEEQRLASTKIAARFIKTLSSLDISYQTDMFTGYCAHKGGPRHRATAYGVFCASVGIPKEYALFHYLYAQCSGTVTNLVKSVPLSQTDGQKLLYGVSSLFTGIITKALSLDEDSICLSAPGFDIRGMQHERLYSRLYMS